MFYNLPTRPEYKPDPTGCTHSPPTTIQVTFYITAQADDAEVFSAVEASIDAFAEDIADHFDEELAFKLHGEEGNGSLCVRERTPEEQEAIEKTPKA